jgi:hypothetical protein
MEIAEMFVPYGCQVRAHDCPQGAQKVIPLDVESIPQPRLKRGNSLGFFFSLENYGDVAMKFFPSSLEPSLHRPLPKDI